MLNTAHKKRSVFIASIIALFVLLLIATTAAYAASEKPPNSTDSNTERNTIVYLLKIDGAIGTATVDYFNRNLEAAQKQQAQLVVLQRNTPGGLDSSMRDIIRAILASPIPVAGFAGLQGARAASAGTYIMVRVHGEIWHAVTEQALRKGDKLSVKSVDGLQQSLGKTERGEQS